MRPVRWMARLAVVATLALLGGLLAASPALAVETDAVRTDYFAQFTDGNVGWFKLVLEKDNSNNQGRAKVTVWCEPDTVLGGSKVPCDAIQYGLSSTGGGQLSAQYWREGVGWTNTDIVGFTDPADDVHYTPPSAGYAIWTGWDCSGQGPDQYRARIWSFRAASSNQWSAWYERVTPTWNGTLC